MSDAVDSFIERKLGGTVDSENENVNVECPECGKEKMYIHREKGLAFCFTCEYKANLAKLLHDVMGVPMEIARVQAKMILANSKKQSEKKYVAISDLIIRLVGETKSTDKEPVKLPLSAVKIAGTPGLRYLQGRGFTEQHLAPYNLHYCPRTIAFTPTSNHIIFPDYDPQTKKLRYWTTRAAYEPKNGHKSYNPKGVPRRGILYGTFATKGKTCVIVEGPLDAIACRGAAILGLYLTEAQAITIAERFDKAVICLDKTAKENTVRSAQALMKYGVETYINYLEWKDPAAAPIRGYELRDHIISNAIPVAGGGIIRERLLL